MQGEGGWTCIELLRLESRHKKKLPVRYVQQGVSKVEQGKPGMLMWQQSTKPLQARG
jgi:hypothetical protein